MYVLLHVYHTMLYDATTFQRYIYTCTCENYGVLHYIALTLTLHIKITSDYIRYHKDISWAKHCCF